MKKENILKLGIAGVIGIVLLILFFVNCYTVDTGEVAIISTFGKIERVETEGLNFKMPFIQSTEI